MSRMRATRGVCVSRVRATPGGAARDVCGVVTAARWEKTGRGKASLPLKAIVDRSAAADEETAAFALHSSSASELMGFENATNEEIDVDATALRTTTIGEFTTERRQQLSVITADAGLVVDTVVASAETNKTQSFQTASKLRSLGAVWGLMYAAAPPHIARVGLSSLTPPPAAFSNSPSAASAALAAAASSPTPNVSSAATAAML